MFTSTFHREKVLRTRTDGPHARLLLVFAEDGGKVLGLWSADFCVRPALGKTNESSISVRGKSKCVLVRQPDRRAEEPVKVLQTLLTPGRRVEQMTPPTPPKKKN